MERDVLFPGRMGMPMKITRVLFGIATSRTSRACEVTEQVAGRKPVLALLMPLLWATALALPVLGAQAGAVLSTLHSFSGTNGGANPMAALVQGSDGYFYGTTYLGGTGYYDSFRGTSTAGTVFRISTYGALTTLYLFTGRADGANPLGSLVQGLDGSFYGTTYWGGGVGGHGTVFRLTIVPEFQAATITNDALSLT